MVHYYRLSEALVWKGRCWDLRFISVGQQPLVGQGLLIVEASRSHIIKDTTLDRNFLDE